MCMAQPMAQTTPTHPAPYPPDEMYKTATTNTVAADGTVTQGGTIASQLGETIPDPNASKHGRSASTASSAASGANTNYRM